MPGDGNKCCDEAAEHSTLLLCDVAVFGRREDAATKWATSDDVVGAMARLGADANNEAAAFVAAAVGPSGDKRCFADSWAAAIGLLIDGTDCDNDGICTFLLDEELA